MSIELFRFGSPAYESRICMRRDITLGAIPFTRLPGRLRIPTRSDIGRLRGASRGLWNPTTGLPILLPSLLHVAPRVVNLPGICQRRFPGAVSGLSVEHSLLYRILALKAPTKEVHARYCDCEVAINGSIQLDFQVCKCLSLERLRQSRYTPARLARKP